jgi:hypothetical protein
MKKAPKIKLKKEKEKKKDGRYIIYYSFEVKE